MACGGCAKRREGMDRERQIMMEDSLVGKGEYINNQQLKARLETYKRKYCKKCVERFNCDYERFLKCKGK
jgi:hypothetical protein